MKQSLWKAILHYGKTKGKAPLDERQMDVLKNLYMELARNTLLAFMIFAVAYGYCELYGKEISYPFFTLSASVIGCITDYYLLHFCYKQVVGIDETFEVLIIPALLFTPFLFMAGFWAIGFLCAFPNPYFKITACLWPVFFFLNYSGANRVYQKGREALEQEIEQGQIRFRSRKQIINYLLFVIIVLCILPIPYDYLCHFVMISGSLFLLGTMWQYGFSTPHNVYILDERGVHFHKALWNRKGGFLPYEQIERVTQQDTFNIGYAKDKVCIHLKSGKDILLYPENSYRFCTEIENNLL